MSIHFLFPLCLPPFPPPAERYFCALLDYLRPTLSAHARLLLVLKLCRVSRIWRTTMSVMTHTEAVWRAKRRNILLLSFIPCCCLFVPSSRRFCCLEQRQPVRCLTVDQIAAPSSRTRLLTPLTAMQSRTSMETLTFKSALSQRLLSTTLQPISSSPTITRPIIRSSMDRTPF